MPDVSGRLRWIASVVGNDAYQPNLHRPWRFDGWLVASNGHAALAMPLGEGDPEGAVPLGAETYMPRFLRNLDAPVMALPLAALREWAGEHWTACTACTEEQRNATCSECEATGV